MIVKPAKFLIRFLPSERILRDFILLRFWMPVIMLVERLSFSQEVRVCRVESIFPKM